MGVVAQRRWAALRALHEDWGVPLPLLEKVTERGEATVTSRAKRDGWVEGNTLSGLHARLVRVIVAQMDRFETSDENIDEEKRARALSVIAKTLETVMATSEKLETNSGEFSMQNSGRPDEFSPELDAAGREAIHSELARLVEGLGDGR